MGEQIVDPKTWETMKAMVDPAFLSELIDEYLKDTPGQIEQMHRGLTAGDSELVGRAAHTLKSNSASFGALHLAELARDLEMQAKSGSLGRAVEKLADIESEFSRLVPALEALKNAE